MLIQLCEFINFVQSNQIDFPCEIIFRNTCRPGAVFICNCHLMTVNWIATILCPSAGRYRSLPRNFFRDLSFVFRLSSLSQPLCVRAGWTGAPGTRSGLNCSAHKSMTIKIHFVCVDLLLLFDYVGRRGRNPKAGLCRRLISIAY